jgi:hypothetical protein
MFYGDPSIEALKTKDSINSQYAFAMQNNSDLTRLFDYHLFKMKGGDFRYFY